MTQDHRNAIAKLCSNDASTAIMPLLPMVSPSNLRKDIMKGIRLSQIEDESKNKLDVIHGNIVGIREGYTADDLSEAQTRLVGHNQSSSPPKNFDIKCPTLKMLHRNKKELRAKVEARGVRTLSNEELMWNDLSLPYGRDPKCNQKLVILFNHYQTSQEARIVTPFSI